MDFKYNIYLIFHQEQVQKGVAKKKIKQSKMVTF